MPDIGGNKYHVTIREIQETKERKRLWIKARIKETEAAVANLEHTLLGHEQMLGQLKEQDKLNEKSIEA